MLRMLDLSEIDFFAVAGDLLPWTVVGLFTYICLEKIGTVFTFNRITATHLLESLDQMVFRYFWDKTTGQRGLSMCTSNIVDYYGFKREQVLSGEVDIFSRIHPDDFKRLQAQSQRSHAEGNMFAIEKRILGKEGLYRWTHCRSVLLKDSETRQEWLGVLDDVSDWRSLCREYDRERAKQASLEDAMRLAFDIWFYLDDKLNLVNSPIEPLASFLNWIPERLDRAKFTHVVDAARKPSQSLPLVVELDLKLFGHGKSRKSDVYVVSYSKETEGDYQLVGIRPKRKNVCRHGVIAIELQGDLTEFSGFLFAFVEDRETFRRLWINQGSLPDLLACLRRSHLGNLDVLSEAEISENSRAVLIVIKFLTLTLCSSRWIGIDKDYCFNKILDTVADFSTGETKADALYLLALAVANCDVSQNTSDVIFDLSSHALVDHPRLYSEVLIARGCQGETHAASWFRYAAERIVLNTDHDVYLLAVALYNLALTAQNTRESQQADQQLVELVTFYYDSVRFDERILNRVVSLCNQL